MGEKDTKSSGLLKSTLIIFLPLITAILTANYQYVITRWENSDKNYRVVVSELTSKDKDKRHAAAASIGTYVKIGDRYFNESIDILTNRLSSESNHNVRNSIISSLKKIKDEPEYRQVIDRLLTIDRNNFIQDYQMKALVDKSKVEFDNALAAYQQGELDYSNSDKESDRFVLGNLATETAEKHEVYQALQQDYDELKTNIPTVSNMISIFLSEKKGREMVGLDFFRSNMHNLVITDLKLKKTKIKWATFSSSTLSDSEFIESTIARTYFSNSDLKNTSFVNSRISNTVFSDALLINTDFTGCQFKDVFFIGADLTNTNFSGVSGLQPELFFGAINLDHAIFDDPGFVARVLTVDQQSFETFVANSSLNNDKKEYLVPGST